MISAPFRMTPDGQTLSVSDRNPDEVVVIISIAANHDIGVVEQDGCTLLNIADITPNRHETGSGDTAMDGTQLVVMGRLKG